MHEPGNNKEPKRAWFRYGEPWGLLAKTNPNSTPTSVLWKAIFGGLTGTVVWLALQHWQWRNAPLWTLLPVALLIAFVAGLAEYQNNDRDDHVV